MNENDEWKKEKSNEPRSSKYLRISRDLIRLGFDSTSAWKFVFVKWFPNNSVCTQDVTLLLWAKLQQVSAAPKRTKITSQRKKKQINQNVQLIPRGSERSGLIKIRTLDLRGADWPETRLQTRLAISSFSQVSQRLSANFPFNTQISLGTDTFFQTQMNENATKISEFIEYSPSYLLVLILSWNTAQRRTQHKDLNKFRQQRQMIQITKKKCSIAFQPNERKPNLKIFWSICLCFSKENFRRQS